MKNIKNILIPVDFSTCAKNAVRYGVSLAQTLKARLFLLNAYEYPIGMVEMSYAGNNDFYQQIEEDAHIEMEVLERNLLYGTGIEYYTICKAGPTLDSICKAVEEYHIEMVLMGTHSKSNVDKILFGGNTAGVLGKFDLPVFAIPEQAHFSRFDNFVLAYDFLCYKEQSVIEPLLALARANNATIHVLHVGDKNLDSQDIDADNGSWISECLKDVKHAYHFIQGEEVETAIWQYTKEEHADLLALKPRKKRSLLDRLFSKSLTRTMVYHPHLPLLILQ